MLVKIGRHWFNPDNITTVSSSLSGGTDVWMTSGKFLNLGMDAEKVANTIKDQTTPSKPVAPRPKKQAKHPGGDNV